VLTTSEDSARDLSFRQVSQVATMQTPGRAPGGAFVFRRISRPAPQAASGEAADDRRPQ
jgi:hypothetical protein